MVADEVQMCRIVQDGERHDRKELIVTVDQELVLTPLARDRVRLGSVARPESNAPRRKSDYFNIAQLRRHRHTCSPGSEQLGRLWECIVSQVRDCGLELGTYADLPGAD